MAQKAKEGQKHDKGPYVRRGALIMGAEVEYDRQISPLRTQKDKKRTTVAIFDPNTNQKWEANLEFVLAAMNKAGGYKEKKAPQEEDEEGS